jgi:hypothetical protein
LRIGQAVNRLRMGSRRGWQLTTDWQGLSYDWLLGVNLLEQGSLLRKDHFDVLRALLVVAFDSLRWQTMGHLAGDWRAEVLSVTDDHV